MTRERMALGRAGEVRAARFLEGLGWRVLDRCWRTRYGEIDIVASDGDTVVFVEVKARSAPGPIPPEAAVGRGKQERLVRAALCYLGAKGISDRPLRFDVVSLAGSECRHIRGAFEAEGYSR